jgi:hypothetical protein
MQRTSEPVSKLVMSRRMLLSAGATCALASTATLAEITGGEATITSGLSPQKQALIRRYYAAWTTNEWHAIDVLLTDDFTFSSPVDDHISKSTFKKRCWDTQHALIQRHDLQHVAGAGEDAFVLYVCHTKSGKAFQNVEYLRLNDRQVEEIECYFGAQNNYPSEVNKHK